jgi:hypothetical protein
LNRTGIPVRRALYEILDAGYAENEAVAIYEGLTKINNGEYVYLDEVNAAIKINGKKPWGI